MKTVIFHPPYPKDGTPTGAIACLEWMRKELERLNPGEQELIVLPEYANAPGLNGRRQVRSFAESHGAEFLKNVSASAARLGSLIVLSGVVRSGERWFNRSMVFDAGGKIAATYDKMHLTDVEVNDLGLTMGASPAVFDYAGIRMGFATCFDLYFPEHFAVLAGEGVDLVLCSSYQRSETRERIELIARARALDSGAYLVSSSYSMGDPHVGGRSLVAAPDGGLLAIAGDAPSVLTVEIDPGRKFVKPASYGRPAVEHRTLIESHRRPAVYRPHPERARLINEASFPRICAHRGLSQACPENTLPAFAAAIASGAHEIEFDLRASRDGVPVVCHDETVDRTTNGRGKVSELSWEDIRRLDAGVRFSESWTGVDMPRFEQVLDLTDGLVGLNIHIYENDPDGSTIKRVCDLLTERALTAISYLALGTEAGLKTACDYAPDIARACLVSQGEPDRSIAIAKLWGCKRIQFGRQVKKEQIQQAREAGLICNLFWSDQPEDAMNYIRNGIDVILTNCCHTMISGGFHALKRIPAGQQPHQQVST